MLGSMDRFLGFVVWLLGTHSLFAYADEIKIEASLV